MNTNLTEIAFVLDRSGSMQPLVPETIDGFNRFLADQQALPGQARLTLVLFDDQFEVLADALPVAEMVPLDERSYTTRGCTALLDAICRTIDELGRRLAAMPESERPGKVIVAILTDGLENASRRFTLADVNARIARQRDAYSWEFLFLGANQDAIATAAAMGIASHNSATFAADTVGAAASQAALSRKASAIRRISMALNDEDARADFHKSTAEILHEESEKAAKELESKPKRRGHPRR
jgi:hypothetical protein